MSSIAEMGIPKRRRADKLKSPRMQQIATALVLYGDVVPHGGTRARTSQRMQDLFRELSSLESIFAEENPAISAMDFIKKLTSGCRLLQ